MKIKDSHHLWMQQVLMQEHYLEMFVTTLISLEVLELLHMNV